MVKVGKSLEPISFGYLLARVSNMEEEIWNKLIKNHEKIFLVLSGHLENVDTHQGLLSSKGVKRNATTTSLMAKDMMVA